MWNVDLQQISQPNCGGVSGLPASFLIFIDPSDLHTRSSVSGCNFLSAALSRLDSCAILRTLGWLAKSFSIRSSTSLPPIPSAIVVANVSATLFWSLTSSLPTLRLISLSFIGDFEPKNGLKDLEKSTGLSLRWSDFSFQYDLIAFLLCLVAPSFSLKGGSLLSHHSSRSSSSGFDHPSHQRFILLVKDLQIDDSRT